jgi:hypothetical protein
LELPLPEIDTANMQAHFDNQVCYASSAARHIPDSDWRSLEAPLLQGTACTAVPSYLRLTSGTSVFVFSFEMPSAGELMSQIIRRGNQGKNDLIYVWERMIRVVTYTRLCMGRSSYLHGVVWLGRI